VCKLTAIQSIEQYITSEHDGDGKIRVRYVEQYLIKYKEECCNDGQLSGIRYPVSGIMTAALLRRHEGYCFEFLL